MPLSFVAEHSKALMFKLCFAGTPMTRQRFFKWTQPAKAGCGQIGRPKKSSSYGQSEKTK